MESYWLPPSSSELCLFESCDSVFSNVTPRHVAMPIENKYHHVTNRLHIQDLPVGTKCKELALFFSKYGVVIDCNIMDTVSPHQIFTYGFVTYHPNIGKETVTSLVINHNAGKQEFIFKGFKLSINFAKFKPKKFKESRPAMRRRGSVEDEDEIYLDTNMGRRGSQISMGGDGVSPFAEQHLINNINTVPFPIYLPVERSTILPSERGFVAQYPQQYPLNFNSPYCQQNSYI